LFFGVFHSIAISPAFRVYGAIVGDISRRFVFFTFLLSIERFRATYQRPKMYKTNTVIISELNPGVEYVRVYSFFLKTRGK